MTRVRDDRNVATDLWLVVILVSVANFIICFLLGLIPVVGLILGYVISGLISLIYGIYETVYLYNAVKDINAVCSKTEDDSSDNSWNYVVVLLISIITLGAYMLYWYYKQGGRLHRALKAYGIESEETGVSYLIWRTLGFLAFGNYISTYLLVKNLNKAARAYNEGKSGKQSNSSQTGLGDDVAKALIERLEKNIKGSDGSSNGSNPPADRREWGEDGPTQKAAMIVGIKGEYAGQKIAITGNDLIVMGRDGSQANLIFRSEKISKAHCKVQFMPNENCFYVVDTSTYGVFLENGKKLEKGQITKLSRGTKIVLGGTEVFQLK